jgi:hypothetical protein
MSKAGELTSAVLQLLHLYNFEAWRQNNLAVRGRKFVGRKGVPDVIGFHRNTGEFIGVEVKAGKDRMSEHQKQFREVVAATTGGIYIEARSIEQVHTELANYFENKEQNNGG